MRVKLFEDKCTWPNCECKDASPKFIAICAAGRNSAVLENPEVVKEIELLNQEIASARSH
jgi:hypothetical protein